MNLATLAERVEGACGADREIDAEIACLIGRPLGDINHWLHASDISYRPTRDGYYVAVLPDGGTSEAFKARKFTASLDAAMSLVPEGANWRVDFQREPIDGTPPCLGLVWFEIGKGWTAHAATPALALTAAALRARAGGAA